jgi:phosphoserine phosphatase RsbU/P
LRVGREGVRLRESNVPVGLLADAEYQSAGFQMEPGDRIIMVTDGVTEAESPAGYGDERLESSSALCMSAEQILASVRLFCAPVP